MSEMQRERDLVLNPNEYAYVLDKTKGLISCVVGSHKMSLSTSDSLVVFNERNKRFEEASFNDAITTFVSAPENWYIVLKNPAQDNKHPIPGTPNSLPDLEIGKKINIRGNASFALYPGQMAKVVQGHRMRSNQYLLARVYDADALKEMEETGKKDEESNKDYAIGQLLVIKGTEVPFYIPPTGIEVIPVGGKGDKYIRDAVTLERLEYCILKDEEGNKKYVHGAAVVFPEPNEVFVENPNGGYKFKAIELSDISGIYVKVIADYEENGKKYKTGEELFITGKEQMIYYPRPEHAIIDYNGKVVHHAIALPAGEGRYILDRKTGEVKTVKGAKMYLPDPRNEVVVKRKLTKKQCELWFPGNREVLAYNVGISPEYENSHSEHSINALYNTSAKDFLPDGFISQNGAAIEDSGFSRGNTYSEPRTITIDNKYNGVVSIDIWTGYAINVISKNGQRKVVVGAQTYLMEYDETLEVLELSTGKPKTTDNLLKTVYLRVDNNKISDLINVQTKDFVDVEVKVSYCVDFLPKYKDKWFSVENYVKYMTDRQRSLIKREAKLHTIEDFYENASDIIRKIALNLSDDEEPKENICGRTGRLFEENGMLVHDVEVLSVRVEDDVEHIINSHQQQMIRKSLELSSASKEIDVITRLAELDKAKEDLRYQNEKYSLELENKIAKERLEKQGEIERLKEQERIAVKTAMQKLQTLLDSIQKSELARNKEVEDAEINHKKDLDGLEIAKQKSQAETIKKVFDSISPDLIAAMTSSSNAEILSVVSEHMSPYAIANGESVADVTNKLLRGTSLEGLIEKIGLLEE